MLKSPENYNEMLPSLNRATAVLTFFLATALTVFGYIPRVKIPKEHLPPFGDYEKLAEWIMSFGLIPIGAAAVALLLSSAFEIHNILSSWLQLRYVWEKFYIVKPLAKQARSRLSIDRDIVKRVMNEFYYPETRKLDQHYVKVFWRYALIFWILFEHVFFVAIAIGVLYFLSQTALTPLVVYFGAVAALCAAQFFAVTARKSRDQAMQIPIDEVRKYFSSMGSQRPRNSGRRP